MKPFAKTLHYVTCALFIFLFACGVNKNRPSRPTVPIAVNIQTDEHQLNSVNLNVYAFKVVDRLEDFNEVDLEVVDEPDSAVILLNITIDQYTSFPPDRRVSRRVFRRAIESGTDANGKPVYQTITASADIVQTRIRTSARFDTNLSIKGTPGKTFRRTFSENLNVDQIYVTNIQGDSRALDPSVYSATMQPMEPLAEDILLALSNKEMLGRLSREISSYYQNNSL